MTPREKAYELCEKFKAKCDDIWYHKVSPVQELEETAKGCALIAVDEILSFLEDDRKGFNWVTFYKEVKEEINKL